MTRYDCEIDTVLTRCSAQRPTFGANFAELLRTLYTTSNALRLFLRGGADPSACCTLIALQRHLNSALGDSDLSFDHYGYLCAFPQAGGVAIPANGARTRIIWRRSTRITCHKRVYRLICIVRHDLSIDMDIASEKVSLMLVSAEQDALSRRFMCFGALHNDHQISRG